TTTTTVHATFQDLITVFVTVDDSTATGTVTTSPTGIACRTGTCSASFPRGTTLTVTAVPGSNVLFGGGFGGGGCSSPPADEYTPQQLARIYTNPCVFTVSPENADIADQALFRLKTHYSFTTQGSGTVTSIPAGLNCPPTCGVDMPQQSTIGFLASPSARWTGNAGGCSRAEKFCSFGTFGPIGDNPIGVEFGFFALGIELFPGPGANGRVVSSPAGIDCDSASNCFNQTVEFPVGTPVTLTPMP